MYNHFPLPLPRLHPPRFCCLLPDIVCSTSSLFVSHQDLARWPFWDKNMLESNCLLPDQKMERCSSYFFMWISTLKFRLRCVCKRLTREIHRRSQIWTHASIRGLTFLLFYTGPCIWLHYHAFLHFIWSHLHQKGLKYSIAQYVAGLAGRSKMAPFLTPPRWEPEIRYSQLASK